MTHEHSAVFIGRAEAMSGPAGVVVVKVASTVSATSSISPPPAGAYAVYLARTSVPSASMVAVPLSSGPTTGSRVCNPE